MKKLYMLLLGLLICAAANAAPASQLYLIGEPAGGWSPLKGTEMTKTSDGIFELDVTLTKTQWFGFSQKLGNNANDWSTMNGARYGAPSNNYQPTLGVSVSLLYPNENSFQMGKGDYHFTVNTNDNTFTVTGQEVEDPTANVLYVRGGSMGWDATEANKMTQNGNTYTLTLASVSGEFKIANSDYSQQFSASSPIELGVATVVENLGSANSKLAVGSAQNVTFTFVKESKTKGTLTITSEGGWEAPSQAYFSGNLDGAWTFNYEMTSKGDGVFALEGIEVTAETGYATFSTGVFNDWTVSDGMRYSPSEEDVNVESGESYDAVAGGDKAFVVPQGIWTAEITFTQEATTVIFTRTGDPVVEPTVPETLYFNGNLNGADWEFNAAMTKADAVFSHDFEVANETGYVTFATAEITDWTVAEGGVRYVPEGNTDEAVESGAASKMFKGTDGCWTMSAGKYTVVADFSGETPTVTFTRTGDIVVVEQPLEVTFDFTTIETIRAMNAEIPAKDEWTKDQSNFYFEVGGVLPLTVDNIAITSETKPGATGQISPNRLYLTSKGIYSYRAYKNNWMTITAPAGYYIAGMTCTGNAALKVGLVNAEDGTLTLSNKKADNYAGTFVPAEGKKLEALTLEPTATSQFATVTVTLAKLGDEPGQDYPVLYFRAGDNGWGADETNLMSCSNGIYTIRLAGLYGAFKIADADWSDANTATTQNLFMEAGVTYTAEHPANGGGNMAMAEPLTDVTVTYDANNSTIQVAGTVDANCTISYLLHGQFTAYTAAEPEEEVMALEETPWTDIELTENSGSYSATVVPAAETGAFVIFNKRNGVDYLTYKTDAEGALNGTEPLQLAYTGYNDARYALDPTHKYELTFNPETGQVSATDAGTTGIEGITVDGGEGSVSYFNLQGVGVAHPSAGLYIVVRNGKAAKEYVR